MVCFVEISGDSGGSRGGANPAMAPPAKLAMEFVPLRDRKSNGSIVILLKSKDFGPPRIDVGYGFGPPLWKNWKNTILKHEKGHQKILGDRWNFLGKCRQFFGKRLKKVVKNLGTNLAPVSE